MRYDLHIHSKYSHDGTLEPRQIIKIAMKRGLSGVAITDHGTIKGALKAKEECGNCDIDIIVGAEILTDIGEVIGLFIEEEVKSKRFEEVVDEIRAQNGIVVVPHPFDDFRKSALHPSSAHARFIDCVEVMNARCRLQQFNKRAQQYADAHHLGITAGSDAHFADEIGNAGVCIEDEDVRNALLKRKVQIFGSRTPTFKIIFSKLRSMRDKE